MSESASIRQNLQNVPSIFEITAAETLDSLIYPALRKVFDFFGLRLDFKLKHRQSFRDELSPFVTWMLQYMYLRKRGASFGESFYGLQRTTTATGGPISQTQKITSATILTFLPYLEQKLRFRSEQRLDTSTWEQYVLKALHVYKASKAIHTFLYLIKYASSHSLIFRALGLTLRYPEKPPTEDKATFLFLKILEVFAFFLQFIQWWYSSEHRRKIGGTLRNPAPINQKQGEIASNLPPKGNCPVCLMRISTPTACSLSGYVYCWQCIVNYIKIHSKCPVTGYPITIDDLVRIHEA